MSYRSRVIYLSLGLLVLVSVLAYFSVMSNTGGDKYAILGFGVVTLAWSIFEAFALLITGIVIRVRGEEGGVASLDDNEEILDAPTGDRPLTAKERASAYFIAMGLVLLVGASLCFGGLAL
ncbi:MAG: hypothetical protein AAFN92_03460 [Bacteroidota bacterium]